MKIFNKETIYRKLILIMMMILFCNFIVPYNTSYAKNEKEKHEEDTLFQINDENQGINVYKDAGLNDIYNRLKAEKDALVNKGFKESQLYICLVHNNPPTVEAFDEEGNGYYARAANDGKTYIIYTSADNKEVTGEIVGEKNNTESPSDQPMDEVEEQKREEANSSKDLEHSEALQGGKLLTPIVDLLLTLGDGIMDIIQRAIVGTDGHITVDIGISILGIIFGIIAAVLAIAVVIVVAATIGGWVAGLVGRNKMVSCWSKCN